MLRDTTARQAVANAEDFGRQKGGHRVIDRVQNVVRGRMHGDPSGIGFSLIELLVIGDYTQRTVNGNCRLCLCLSWDCS